MLGSPFCIERCSLTVRNKRKARQDGFRPFIPRVLGGKNQGASDLADTPLQNQVVFPAENNHGRLGVCVSISLSRKRGARNPTAIFSIAGLGAHVRSSKEGCDIFFKNAFSISSLRMHLLASCKRAVLGLRVRLACEFVPLRELRVARQARAGWRTGNVTERLFDILINWWYTIWQ